MNFNVFKVSLIRMVVVVVAFVPPFLIAGDTYSWCPRFGDDCVASDSKEEVELYMNSWYEKEIANFISLGVSENGVIRGVVEYFEYSIGSGVCVVFLGKERRIEVRANDVEVGLACEDDSNFGSLWITSIKSGDKDKELKVYVNGLGVQGVLTLDVSRSVRVLDIKTEVKEYVN